MNKLFLFLPLGISIITVSGCRQEKTVPNIVFILADDMGYSQLGCNGSEYYRTPNIDKLAEEGMRFTNAYAACPVCSPTRASIMTGKYPARLHLTDFIPGNDREDLPLLQPDWQKFLPLEEITFAEVLKTRGYSTALFGKWKLIEWYEKSLTGDRKNSFELFDLENDISESENLADSLKAVTDDLAEKLNMWRKEVDASMPVPNNN